MAGDTKRSFIEEARRKQIIAAAIDAIAAVGYTKASFASIAQRAGISPALISYHFGTKAELVAQIVHDIEADMERAINDDVGDAQSYRLALRGVIESQVRYFASHTTEVLALGEIFQATRGDTPVGRRTASERERSIAEIQGMLVEGQEAHEFRSFDARIVAVNMYVALEAVPGELLADPTIDAAAYGRELADLFDHATRR